MPSGRDLWGRNIQAVEVAELPLSGEALVLDALVGLTDEVLQLWKEVNLNGTLIISRLVEEVGNQEQGKE